MSRLTLLGLAALSLACGVSDYELANADDIELSTVEGELRSNADPGKLVVYSNNLENMLFDWKDLVHYMAEADLRPDLFLVQQVTDQAELNQLVGFMERRMGVGYTGVAAMKNPDDHRFQGQVTPRPTVTTGIIFRNGRFDLLSKETWMPWGTGFDGGRQTCDERSWHSGYETIRLKLFDKVAKKNVIAVSLRHWTFFPCSTQNVFDIADGAAGHPGLGGGAALHIVAGDFNDKALNSEGDYKCWYKETNRAFAGQSCSPHANLQFSDAVWQHCNGEKACMKANSGIDYIFARRPDGVRVRTSHFNVVSAAEAEAASRAATGGDGPSNSITVDGYRDQGDAYSQHRARRAYIYYQ